MAVLALYRSKIKFILVALIAFAVLLALYSLSLPHVYQADAELLPPKQSDGGGGLSSFIQSMSGGLSVGGVGQAGQPFVFVGVLKSRAVADYVIKDLKLKKDPKFSKLTDEELRGMITSSLETEVNPRSSIIGISATASTPSFPSDQDIAHAKNLASRVVNSTISGLDEIIRNRSVSSARNSKEYVERELARYKIKLDSIEIALENFQRENKALDIEAQTQAVLSLAGSVAAELAKAEVDLNRARAELEPSSPQIKALEKNYASLKSQYERVQSGGLTPNDAFSIPLKSAPTLARLYTGLFREKKIIEQALLYLETQRHQEAIAENRDLPVVEVLDSAVTQNTRISPKRGIILLGGMSIATLLLLLSILAHAIIVGTIKLSKYRD